MCKSPKRSAVQRAARRALLCCSAARPKRSYELPCLWRNGGSGVGQIRNTGCPQLLDTAHRSSSCGAEICTVPNHSPAGKVSHLPHPGSGTRISPRLVLPVPGTRCRLKPRASRGQPAAPQSIPRSCLLRGGASPTLVPGPHASSTARRCQAAAASEAALSAAPSLPQPQHPRASD